MIPRLARTGGHLYEAHSLLDKAPRHQAAQSIRTRHRVIEAVELAGRFGFLRNIQHFTRGQLHPRGQLEILDSRFEFRFARMVP